MLAWLEPGALAVVPCYKEIEVGISVIIPVAERDEAWKDLLPCLKSLGNKDEIILVSNNSLSDQLQNEVQRVGISSPTHWVASDIGRAKQLNTGAQRARCEFFWFLHSDSKVDESAIKRLKREIKKRTGVIHFFDLRFMNDGPPLMVANVYGTWFRSHCLRLPFGDQGYCMHRETYSSLCGFSETATFGEDHLLIWKAHQRRLKLRCVGAPIYTSARRYQSRGWLKTTTKHLVLTVWQATPQLLRLIKENIV